MMVINNGKWNEFSKVAMSIENEYVEVDVKLVVLSKKVMISYRTGCFGKAHISLQEYEKLLQSAEDNLIFEAIHLYLKAALERAKGEFKAAADILTGALSLAEQIPPGLLTAAILLSYAGMTQNFGPHVGAHTSAELSMRALEHVKRAPKSQIQVDMEQKAHTVLATFHLGCDMSGIVEKDVNKSTLETAKSSIMELHESDVNGYPLSRYREIQFNLAQSALYYRYSQITPEKRIFFLEKAFQFSKEAQNVAKDSHFEELSNWANNNVALFTEKLVLASLIKIDRVSKIYRCK
jgi:hypothetical protein